MNEAGKIEPQPWMAEPATRAVLAALAAGGRPARFVGGCVRDAILGRAVKDIDIATPEPPESVIALLEGAAIKAVPTGIDHGTITAVRGAAHFEVTTLRHDVETFGRHARVAFTDDWEADAARRDFTINALFCDPDGTLYDPTGGLDDLRAGRVRFVGDAHARIEEDVLRLLRFFRFHAWYGRGAPDNGALAACRALADRVPMLSAERVWSELRRIMLAPDAAGILDLMDANGVLAQVLAEAARRDRLRALAALEEKLGAAPDAIRRLAASLDAGPEIAPALADRLRLSRKERGHLAAMLKGRGAIVPDGDARALRLALYRHGAELYRDLVLIDWADDGRDRAALWRAADDWTPPRLPVRGTDAMALGIPEGPAVGRLLRTVESWWIARDFKPARKACLARLGQEAEKAGYRGG